MCYHRRISFVNSTNCFQIKFHHTLLRFVDSIKTGKIIIRTKLMYKTGYVLIGKAWDYQRGNQKSWMEDGQDNAMAKRRRKRKVEEIWAGFSSFYKYIADWDPVIKKRGLGFCQPVWPRHIRVPVPSQYLD